MLVLNATDGLVVYNRTLLGYMRVSSQSFIINYISRLVFIIGTFGNVYILSTVIGRKLYRKSVIFIFLSCIAASDTVSLVIVNLTDELELIEGHEFALISSVVCTLRYYVVYTTTKFSIYDLIAANVFRLYALLRPLRFNGNPHQNRAALKICVIVFAISAVFQSYILFGTIEKGYLGRYIVGNGSTNASVDVYDCGYHAQFHHNIGRATSYLVLSFVVYAVVPGILLTGLSISTLVVLQKNLARQKLSMRYRRASVIERRLNNAYVTARNTASLLIPISFLHVCLTYPRYVILLRYYGDEDNYEPHLNYSAYDLTGRYIAERVVLPLNWGLNFYLQLICSGFFRETMLPSWKILRCGKNSTRVTINGLDKGEEIHVESTNIGSALYS